MKIIFLTNLRGEKTLKKISVLFVYIFFATSLFSCGEIQEANRAREGDTQAKVLARINDVPITEYDIKQILKRIPTGMGSAHEWTEQNILQNLVRDELIYQKSLELGLHRDQEYRQKLAEMEAKLRAFQRQEMANLYRKHVNGKAKVTDAEAQAYFEKNREKLQTKFHVWEIFYRGDDSQIVKAYHDLKTGIPFEKVASRQFPPNLPSNMKTPWDLGEMYWHQIPEPWQGILERLAPGQVSEIIKGPRDRFWVIKLVNRTVDPKITFATEKEKIVEILRQQKTQALYDNMLSEIKAKAKIVFPK